MRFLPQTKAELEKLLVYLWVMPSKWGEAYKLYAEGDEENLEAYLETFE
tara:strand:+ start:8655 stop:8801 length:147 start_codon:yes stop_codon:yes gene_type:complete